ncbi:MAG TPA: DPP IV N-terminal domain-containing protein, partial [Polyangiaceae bacterium]
MRSVTKQAAAALFGVCALVACADDTQAPPPKAPTRGLVEVTREAQSKVPVAAPSAKKALAPIDESFPRLLAVTRNFRLGDPKSMHPTEDGSKVLFLRAAAPDPRQSLWELDVASGKETILLDAAASMGGPQETLSHEERARRERMRINTTGYTSFEASKDGADVVVSLSGRLFRWSRKTGKSTELATGKGAAIDPRLSPDGKRVAYVRDADVYAIALDGGKEERVTTGGTERKSHGLAEFIAEEELDRTRGFWWSPDGKSILYEEADTSKVETLYIQDPAHPEHAPDANPYPRAGTTNATLRFGIVGSHGGATKWIDFDNAKYAYVAQVGWSKNAPPTFYALDRAQRNGLVFSVDPATGKASELVHEHDDAWLNVDASCPRWLEDGSAFLWSTEKNGAWELELHDKKGALVRTVVPKNDGYRELSAVDSEKKVVVVESSVEPTEQGLGVYGLDANGMATYRIAQPSSFLSASFGDSNGTYAFRLASTGAMPIYGVNHVTTDAVAKHVGSAAIKPPFEAKAEIIRIGQDETRVALLWPHGYMQGTKLPLIDAAYAGPGYSTVLADESSYLRAQWLADVTGALVVSIDAKGTPNRGRDWERALTGKLGDVPLEGHVAAIQALEARYPVIDAKRIGIYGWSFGGYISAYAALARPD